MKTLPISLAALILLVLTACNPAYLSRDFSAITADHTSIAVLPFEMVYTGVQPKDLSYQDMLDIEIAESQAFQISFYNEILRSTRKGRKPIRVKMQDYKTTISLLRENGIPLHEVENESPERLATILGVDAVVRARIQKHRLMSDLTSYGIEMGARVLSVLSNRSVWPWLPAGVTQSKDIQATYSLIEKDRGEVLWMSSFNVQADWRQRANDIIDQINRRGARKFPYRDKGGL